MKEESAKFIGNALEFVIDGDRGMANGFLRLFVSGELTGGGQDHRLVVEINGETTGYKGFITANGDWGGGEWETQGIYLGRSAWHLDAQFSADVCISANAGGQRIMTSGLSTFSMSDNRLAGYQSSGVLITSQPLRRIRVRFLTRGVAKGFATLLKFPN